MKIGWDHPPSFPVACMTDETPPRRVLLLGQALMDPDVWVAKIVGEKKTAWVLKGSGGICHPTADVHKHHVLHWSVGEYDDGGGAALAASRWGEGLAT